MDWFPALATAAPLVVVYVVREWFRTRLTASVKAEYDRELSKLQAELRETEIRLAAELRVKDADINALRSGALAAVLDRQNQLNRRQLEAIDQLWAGFCDWERRAGVAKFMQSINFKAAARETESNPPARELFVVAGKAFNKPFGDDGSDTAIANKSRPFVPAPAWALYTAYTAIISYGLMRWQQLCLGLGQKDLVDEKSVAELALAALPHQSALIEKFGADAVFHLLDELKGALIRALGEAAAGEEISQLNVQRAQRVIELARGVTERSSKDISR